MAERGRRHPRASKLLRLRLRLQSHFQLQLVSVPQAGALILAG